MWKAEVEDLFYYLKMCGLHERINSDQWNRIERPH